jgi:hypothetical protein
MKSHNRIEFGISDFKSIGNKATIEGRCHSGPIVPGDIFTVISEMTVLTSPQTVGPTKLCHLAALSLRVDSIWAYGHQINELSQTMTARLELTGTGCEHLKAGLVLS